MKTKLTLLTLLFSAIITAQFTTQQIDSIYSKLVKLDYCQQENEILKSQLTKSNLLKNELVNKTKLLENSVVFYKENETLYIDKIQNKDKEILFVNEKLRIQKRKQLPTFIKGLVVGAGVILTIIAIK